MAATLPRQDGGCWVQKPSRTFSFQARPERPFSYVLFVGHAPETNTLASKDDSRVFSHTPLRHVSQDEISGFYLSVAAPLLERAGLSPSERGFRHAYALVSSRAFMVDAYHGLAMVPIADAWVMTSFVR
jgi:hypothetical protein